MLDKKTSSPVVTLGGRRFHAVWLRDNCLCPDCRDPSSFQKIFDLSALDTPAEIAEVHEGADAVRVGWTDGHASVFPYSFLAAHAYDDADLAPARAAVERRRPDQMLWDAASVCVLAPEKHQIDKTPRAVWTEEIARLGFTILSNVPELTDLIRMIGPIRPMETGKTYDVGIKPADFGLSQTHHPLLPHNDYEGFLHTANLLQFLHCVENRAEGGDSILVDGWKVAEDLRRDAPELFDLLATQPVQFEKFDTGSGLFNRRTRTVIVTDDAGEVLEVSFNNSHAWQWDLPFDRVEAYYDAYTTFFRMLKDTRYHYTFRMEPGDCYIVQGARVLHSRGPQVKGSGRRHMVTALTEYDYLLGRRNYLEQKHLFLGADDPRGDPARIESVHFAD